MVVGRDHDDGVAAHDGRRKTGDEAVERGLVGREDRDHAGRLGDGEVEVRAGNGIRRAEHLGELVRPARVPDDAIDRALDLTTAGAHGGEARRPASPSSRRAGTAPDRGCRRSRAPNRRTPCAPRRRPRARPSVSPRDVVALDLERPPGLGARERAADEQLVGLPDRRGASPVIRTSGTPRARGGRPRGRSRTPCSRRTASRIEAVEGVGPHDARAQPLGHPEDPRALLRPDPGREPVHRVVRLLDRLVRRPEGEHLQHRPEDLLLRDPVALRDAREHGRREPVAALGQLAGRLVDLRPLLLPACDELADPVELRRRVDRTDVRVLVERVADAQGRPSGASACARAGRGSTPARAAASPRSRRGPG